MEKSSISYPINLILTGKTCLVIGGNDSSLHIMRSLLEAGAAVHIIAKKVVNEIHTLHRMHLITWKKKSFAPQDLKNIFLVFVTEKNKHLSRKITAVCHKKNILVNAAATPVLSNFINPPTIRRGNLMFTVITGGQSNTLSAAISKELETRYGREYARFLRLLGEIKGEAMEKMLGGGKHKKIFQKLMHPDMMQLDARRNLKKFLVEVKKILDS